MPRKTLPRVWEICEPHPDVFARDPDPSLFAASLAQVERGVAAEDYVDPERFFQKTFMTRSLANLLESVIGRLSGVSGRGAPVLQLQTPFGGGKTHTLVALYHVARHPQESSEALSSILKHLNIRQIPPDIKVAVLDGRALEAKGRVSQDTGITIRTLWGELAYRLGGPELYSRVREHDESCLAPGEETIFEILRAASPALILIDELIEYLAKVKGIAVGRGTLAEQTGTFLAALSVAVAANPRAVMVVSLPASPLEVPTASPEEAQRFFDHARKVLGRVELVETPVAEDEIFGVLRLRLFRHWGTEREIKQVVREFTTYYDEYARVFPDRIRRPDYRERMAAAYPFHPELIDLLYNRWGPHPQFQRTRGALRLLALVIRRLWHKRPGSAFFIQPHHIDLVDRHIRSEVVKLLGSEYDAIVTSDILGKAGDIDRELGRDYYRENLARGAASCAFLYTISAATGVQGATEEEIRVALLRPDLNPALCTEVLGQLRDKLWYLVYRDRRYRFQNRPNINKMILDYEESAQEEEIEDKINAVLEEVAGRGKTRFRIHVSPRESRAVEDRLEPTLVILPWQWDDPALAEKKMREFTRFYGEGYRTHKNALVFLAPRKGAATAIRVRARRLVALENLKDSGDYRTMEEEDQRDVTGRLKEAKRNLRNEVFLAYTSIYRPTPEGVQPVRITQRDTLKADTLAEWVWQALEHQGTLITEMGPDYLKDKILTQAEEVTLEQVRDVFFNTPGQPLLAGEEVLTQAVVRGVEEGVFGYVPPHGREEAQARPSLYFREKVSEEAIARDGRLLAEARAQALKAAPPLVEEERHPRIIGLRVTTGTQMLYPLLKAAEMLRQLSAQVKLEVVDETGALEEVKEELESLFQDYGVTYRFVEKEESTITN